MAERAGVSVGTVSNVLNRPELVAPDTRTRVQATIDELGFVRNGSASRLRASRSTAVGLVVLDVANPFFTEVARGAEAECEAAGYTVMLCNSDGSAARQERHLQFLEEQRVAGLLITPTGARPAGERLDALAARGTAVVLVDESAPGNDRCAVSVDDVRGGELAGAHLLDGGRRRIVHLTGPASVRQCADRRLGLERALERAAHDASLEVVTIDVLNGRAGHGATDRVLAHRPDAVFCANDLIALGLLRGLTERGIVPGPDLALVGYDDIDFAALSSLTSVRQPALELGRSAARLLIDECEQGEAHRHQQVVFEPELIVRSSSSVEPAAADGR